MKQEINESKPENDKDSDYTDVEDEDENNQDSKQKLPRKNLRENVNLEEHAKKMTLKDLDNGKQNNFEETKKGKYYQHDNRNEENLDKDNLKSEKWNHDKFNSKERHERKQYNRKIPNKQYQKHIQNNQSDNKGVAFDEYMKQNEPEKSELKPRPNQPKPRDNKRNEAKPTSAKNLKNRLDFSTRVPTVLDGMHPQQDINFLIGHNQAHRGHNRPYGHHSEKKFDKPFEKNEKMDIVVTTNFQDSSRQVSVSNNNNRNRQHDRRPAQNNRQDNFSNFGNFGGNHRRNHGNQSYDDKLHPYQEYMGYGEFSANANANDNSEFSNTRNQSKSNQNYEQTQALNNGNRRPITRGNQ